MWKKAMPEDYAYGVAFQEKQMRKDRMRRGLPPDEELPKPYQKPQENNNGKDIMILIAGFIAIWLFVVVLLHIP